MDHALAALAPAPRDELFGLVGLRVRGARLREGAGRLVVARVRRLDPPQEHLAASTLASPLAVPLLGAMAESDEGRYVRDLRDQLTTMRGEWPDRLLALGAVWFWEEAQLPVAELEPLLAELDRGETAHGIARRAGSPQPEDDAVSSDDELPEDDAAPPDAAPPEDAPATTPVAREVPGDDLTAGALLARAGRGRFAVRDVDAPALRAVPELFTGTPARPGEWLARGYVATRRADQPPGIDAPTPDARFAFEVGHLVALLELHDDRAIADIHAGGDLLVRVMTTAGLECLTAPLLLALVDPDPDAVVSLLGTDPRPFDNWSILVRPVLDATRARIAAGDPIGAERLLAALDDRLTVAAAEPGAPDAEAAAHAADQLGVERARCRRIRHDFAGAASLLSRVPARRLMGRARAEREVEEALTAAGIAEVADAPMPPTPLDRERWRTRVARSRDAARRALAIAPDHGVAHLLVALDALATGDDEAAVGHLTGALDGLGRAGAAEGDAATLAAGLRFHRGLARLRLLESGTDDAAFADLRAGLAGGHDPGIDDLLDALNALEAHGSSRVTDLLAVLAERAPGDERVTAALARAAVAGAPDAVDLAHRLAARPGLSHATRWALLEAALAGHAAAGAGLDERVEQIADAFEDVVTHAARSELDERWAVLLHGDDTLRGVVGPALADTLRVHALRRLGRIEDARDLGRQLFYRSLERADTAPAEILELLRDLGADAALLDELAALVRDGEDEQEHAPTVRILFVGGDESHARYREGVERALAERHGSSLIVEWWFPGWSSAWAETAEAIESRYPDADAVVIMTLVRTMFGRRIRRTAGEAGLPWIACTGHGRGSVERAIDAAARVARA